MLVCLFVPGCVEEITFDNDRLAGQLVVDGRITDKAGPHELKLSRTSAESNIPLPLNGASVAIVDGDDNREDYVESKEPGTYRLMNQTVKGERGKSYYIDIHLPNGKKYRSFPETIPISAGKDSAYFEVGKVQEQMSTGRNRERNAVMIYADTELPDHSDPLFFKWEVTGMYRFQRCYITQPPDPQNVSLFSTAESDVDFIEKQLLTIKTVDATFEFYGRHYFFITLSSITENRYKYWKQVNEITNNTGTVFDTPPAAVEGNVYNIEDETEQVLGYFEAAAVDTSQIFTLKSDFPFFIPNPCGQTNPYRHHACGNCLRLKNSSVENPFE